MKMIDPVAQRILSLSIGLCVILLGSGFFVHSIGSLKADTVPNDLSSYVSPLSSGRYQTGFQATDNNDSRNFYLWQGDSETGKIQVWYWDWNDKKMVKDVGLKLEAFGQ